MIDNLPKPIALYIEAENNGDMSLFDQCFTDDAVVFDENERREGLPAIKEWKSETKRKYQHTVEPLSIIEKEGRTIVTNRLTGKFPGSPIELEFAFTLRGNKIVSLEILS
jgi:ketosteroid isomerase-like protein